MKKMSLALRLVVVAVEGVEEEVVKVAIFGVEGIDLASPLIGRLPRGISTAALAELAALSASFLFSFFVSGAFFLKPEESTSASTADD